jgi:HEPN domain-containing protein
MARELARTAAPLHDGVSFHSQQSAEKFLKAILNERGLPIPKIHDLDDLLSLLLPNSPVLRRLRRGLVFLSDFAVETRYPGSHTTKRQAQAALRWACARRPTLCWAYKVPYDERYVWD